MVVASTLLDANKSFTDCDFGLDRRLTKAVARKEFVHATLVQVNCIPLALQGKDLMVRARTGSGKTAAFVLPLLQKILKTSDGTSKSIKAVILVPTKELVEQMRQNVLDFMYYCKDVISVLALGGESIETQQTLLRNLPDILISTPSKLVAHIDANNVDLKSSVNTLVIDEADLVLSFGYQSDVRAIFATLPKVCQSFFMSATLSPELDQLKRAVLHNPAIIKLEEGHTDGKLKQFYVSVKKKDKDLLLYALLKLGVLAGKVLFFTNNVEAAYRLKLFFEQFSIKAAVLNGELPFNSRQHIIQEFNRGILDYVIATDDSIDKDAEEEEKEDTDDEATFEDFSDFSEEEEKPQPVQPAAKRDKGFGVARGIDFRGVAFVVNVDFPKSAKSYIHRIGRTARGGASGTALSLVAEEEVEGEIRMLQRVQDVQDPIIPDVIGNTGSSALAAKEEEGEKVQFVSQPAPLEFDISEIDCFRYRVEDIRRAVTGIGIREARLSDVKKEMLNSERLKAHFEDNPRDLSILQHDKAVGTARVQPHLAHVPSYLVPEALQAPLQSKKRKVKNSRRGGYDKKKRQQNDPLQSFEAGNDNDDNNSTIAADPMAVEVLDGKNGLGSSTAGRQRWKKAHRRGDYNPKNYRKNPLTAKGPKH